MYFELQGLIRVLRDTESGSTVHRLGPRPPPRTCLSTAVFCRTVTLAEPMSPDVLNLTPSC